MFNCLRNNYRFQSYARMCARRGNLHLVFETGVPRPRTNGDTMYLPLPNMMTSAEDRMKMIYYVNHESNHHEYNTDFEMLEKDDEINPSETVAGNIWNGIEDDRVDYYSCMDWRGVRENAELYFEWIMPVLMEQYEKAKVTEGVDPDYLHVRSAITCISVLNRCRILGSCRSYVDEYRAILSPEAQKAVQKYEDGGYQDELFAAPSSIEGSSITADIAKRMARDLFDEPKPEAKEEREKRKKELAEMIDKLDKMFPESSLQLAPHGEKMSEKDKTESGGSPLIPPSMDSREFEVLPLDQIKVVDFEKGTYTNCSKHDGDTFVEADKDYELRNITRLKNHADGKKLSNVIRKLLQTKSRKKYKYGQKKGKIAAKNLSRLVTGGATAERIFKKKGDALSLDVALQLVVDYSSSMQGTRVWTAIISAGLLCDTVSRSLRIPVDVIGFSGRTETRMSIFKSFDRPVTATQLEDRMADACSHMAQNADGEALIWAYNRLIVRKEKRKVMIVLSDGEPHAGRYGNIEKYTKKVIEDIEDNSPVEIVGIGIQTDAATKFYKASVRIDRTSELEDALLNVVKSKILTGDRR